MEKITLDIIIFFHFLPDIFFPICTEKMQGALYFSLSLSIFLFLKKKYRNNKTFESIFEPYYTVKKCT